MNYKAVYRTAPATPGLLKSHSKYAPTHNMNGLLVTYVTFVDSVTLFMFFFSQLPHNCAYLLPSPSPHQYNNGHGQYPRANGSLRYILATTLQASKSNPVSSFFDAALYIKTVKCWEKFWQYRTKLYNGLGLRFSLRGYEYRDY